MKAVAAMRAAGMQSIDVGCMQINLRAHPAAFASIDDAFDPAANADYAARFLRDLLQRPASSIGDDVLSLAHPGIRGRLRKAAARPHAPAGRRPALGLRGDKAPARKSAVEPQKTRSLLLVTSIHGAAWPGR